MPDISAGELTDNRKIRRRRKKVSNTAVFQPSFFYISEFDFFKGGLTICHVDKVIRENGPTVDDGLHEIFVNTAIDNDSDIAKLMSCFEKKEVSSSRFPRFTQRVNYPRSKDRWTCMKQRTSPR